MNYLEIVVNGYFNENNREYLERYFFREYKKAEREQQFEADEFFSGCRKVIEGWEKHLQDQIHERKKELYELLTFAKMGKAAERDGQGFQQTIDDCKNALRDVRPDGIGGQTFTIDLYSLTNGLISYNMTLNEAFQIKDAIQRALNKQLVENTTVKQIEDNSDLDTLAEWIALYPELAEKEFPELVQELRNKVREISPVRTAIMINKLPKHFAKWKTETEQLFGLTRKKNIQIIIELLNLTLETEYRTEIEKQAVESVRDELTEQLGYWTNELNKQPDKPLLGKDEILKQELTKYGFLNLTMVRELSDSNQLKLVENMSNKGIPYCIAMFDYLGFLRHLETKHFSSKYKLYIEVSKWFQSDKDGRTIKGNVLSLASNTTENKDRYTAYQHKETVKKDYQLLK